VAYDAIVIGAGLGGLTCACRLVRHGLRVLILEKCPHVGGTSSVFRRKGFSFPMGPLAFGFPGKVNFLLSEAGVDKRIRFRRNHFALKSPGLEIHYSKPLVELGRDLAGRFPEEGRGIESFLNDLRTVICLTEGLETWHPDYLLGFRKAAALSIGDPDFLRRCLRVRNLAVTPAGELLDFRISSAPLRNFLGSLGTDEPEMSMLSLAFMWNVMSETGIWSPVSGIQSLSDSLADAYQSEGGEVRLSAPVGKILVERGRAVGVETVSGEIFESRWVISGADYKTTFLDLLSPADFPADHLERVRTIPYTGSGMSVYLGVDVRRLDLAPMAADHVFFRSGMTRGNAGDPEDFGDREIEICLWARDVPELVPEARAALVLRVSFPYDHFAAWRTGEKTRKEGYRDHKIRLADSLVTEAEKILPGLPAAVEVMEVSTTLTYQDWGHRHRGSIAGWSWSAGEATPFGGKLLIETPVPRLLTAGIYSAIELFLGGVPTAMVTGRLAAGIVLES